MNYYDPCDCNMCCLGATLGFLAGIVIGGAGMFLLLYR
jgi:hypothetical protein